MILAKNGLVELNYDVQSDILQVKWPDLNEMSMLELGETFNMMIDALKHYDIKKLFIDSRLTSVQVSPETYKNSALEFAQKLVTTRVKKVARVTSYQADREKTVSAVTEEIYSKVPPTFISRNFDSPEEAMHWLSEN